MLRKLGASLSPDCLARRPFANRLWLVGALSAQYHPAPYAVLHSPAGKLLSHLGRMPSLRRARSGSGQNLQKSTQVEASGEANSSNDSLSHRAAVRNLSCRLSFLRLFRAPKSG